MTDHGMENRAYAALTSQGYLPTSKTDRMAVVAIVVDVVLGDLRAKVEALPADMYGYVYVGSVLALIDGGSE